MTTSPLAELCKALNLGLQFNRAFIVSGEWDHVESNLTILRCNKSIHHLVYKQGIACLPDECRPRNILLMKWVDRKPPPGWKRPTVEDVMYAWVSDSDAYINAYTFKEFCDNYGYSDDSIKAKAMYESCIQQGLALRRSFTTEQITALQDACTDY